MHIALLMSHFWKMSFFYTKKPCYNWINARYDRFITSSTVIRPEIKPATRPYMALPYRTSPPNNARVVRPEPIFPSVVSHK